MWKITFIPNKATWNWLLGSRIRRPVFSKKWKKIKIKNACFFFFNTAHYIIPRKYPWTKSVLPKNNPKLVLYMQENSFQAIIQQNIWQICPPKTKLKIVTYKYTVLTIVMVVVVYKPIHRYNPSTLYARKVSIETFFHIKQCSYRWK